MPGLYHELHRIESVVQGLPRPVLISIACLTLAFLEILNYTVGHEVRLVFFYFPALFLLTWFVSSKSALALAAFSSVVWYAVGFDLLELTTLEHAWNALMRFFIFLTFILITRAYKKERAFARQDFLTKIANSQQFTELARIEIERCRRYGRPFSVVYMDIDDFKNVNDSLGHAAGDELLFSVAQTIRSKIRAADTAARLGGDEFAILLPETEFEAALALAQKIRVLLLESIQDRFWQCTFSFGLVTFLSAPSDPDEMIRFADRLMYEAKGQGKDRVVGRIYQLPQRRGFSPPVQGTDEPPKGNPDLQ